MGADRSGLERDRPSSPNGGGGGYNTAVKRSPQGGADLRLDRGGAVHDWALRAVCIVLYFFWYAAKENEFTFYQVLVRNDEINVVGH